MGREKGKGFFLLLLGLSPSGGVGWGVDRRRRHGMGICAHCRFVFVRGGGLDMGGENERWVPIPRFENHAFSRTCGRRTTELKYIEIPIDTLSRGGGGESLYIPSAFSFSSFCFFPRGKSCCVSPPFRPPVHNDRAVTLSGLALHHHLLPPPPPLHEGILETGKIFGSSCRQEIRVV